MCRLRYHAQLLDFVTITKGDLTHADVSSG